MSKLRPGVLFDVDGTLVDTNYLHTLAWWRTLRDEGEWAPMHAIHRLVGMGGERMVVELLGHESDAVTGARPARYRELSGEIRAFPGACELLRRARSAGLAVVLATSSPDDELRLSLDRLQCDDVIDAQTTADDVREAKPAPDVFEAAMEAGRVDPARAVAVGDSTWDVIAARAAGIPCIGLESGGFGTGELEETGALCVYRDVADLCARFSESPLAALGPG